MISLSKPMSILVAMAVTALCACTANTGSEASSLSLDATRNALEVTRLSLVITQTAMAIQAAATVTPAATPTPAKAGSGAAPKPTAALTSTPIATVAARVEVPNTGKVSGKMFYPSSSIPPMTLYFENINSNQVITLPIKLNQMTYDADLPPGDYYVYAWLTDYTLSGGFTTCKENNACDTHNLQAIRVKQDTVIVGIDIYDWYATRPLRYPPGVNRPVGAISGRVNYPASHVPAMMVYARNMATNDLYMVNIEFDQREFTIKNLPVGAYEVFAWAKADGQNVMTTLGGTYSVAVACGLTASCTDHQLVTVSVSANQTTTGVDVFDWYDQPSVPKP